MRGIEVVRAFLRQGIFGIASIACSQGRIADSGVIVAVIAGLVRQHLPVIDAYHER